MLLGYIMVALLTLSGIQIERVPCYKYLDIWVEDKLNFKKHIAELTKKLKAKLAILYRHKAYLSTKLQEADCSGNYSLGNRLWRRNLYALCSLITKTT